MPKQGLPVNGVTGMSGPTEPIYCEEQWPGIPTAA
ncbi:MAG: hypothetical protein RIQ46_779, partial [Pseudomonadota bacterium]